MLSIGGAAVGLDGRLLTEEWSGGFALASRRCRATRLALHESRLPAPLPNPMRHFVVGDDATGIGISKAALDHQAESQFPNEFLTGTVVWLLQQQMDEVFLRRGHGSNRAHEKAGRRLSAPGLAGSGLPRPGADSDEVAHHRPATAPVASMRAGLRGGPPAGTKPAVRARSGPVSPTASRHRHAGLTLFVRRPAVVRQLQIYVLPRQAGSPRR